MIDDIKKNLSNEMNILKEIAIYSQRLEFSNPVERNLLVAAINSLQESMKILNDSIPELIAEISLAQKLTRKSTSEPSKFERINYSKDGKQFIAIISRKDRNRLLKELEISEKYLKKLKKKRKDLVEEYIEFKAARGYLKLANRLFLNTANNFFKKGYFKTLSRDLHKSNIDMLSQGYIAMVFTTTLLFFIASIVLFICLIFFNVELSTTPFSYFDGNYLQRILKLIWMPFAIPILVFAVLYYYPLTEIKSIERRVNQELPFAVIHMSAISGSGIQPSEIFRIIGLSREYPYLRKEIRKVLNQINLYGYDLVTALNNAASGTSSEKLAELFSGLATTINSGGNFSEFFNKRAETLLLDYRLERQKYARTAETLMDIYISIVIAAPMVLMLFLIILAVGSFSVGLSTGQLTFIIIAVIALVNMLFLVFIHMNQPTY